MNSMRQQLRRARERGASLIAITTADQQGAAREIAAEFEDDADGVGVMGWDTVRGPHGLSRLGISAAAMLCGDMDPSAVTDFPSMSELARTRLPGNAVVVVANAHRLVEGADALRCVQGIANLRDPFGGSGSTLVLLAPAWRTPPELGADVLPIDDALPTEDERRALAAELVASAREDAPELTVSDDDLDAAANMTRGISRYGVEQTVSLALEPTGIDRAALKSRWVAAINATPGLRYEPDAIAVEQIGGLENYKRLARLIADSRQPPQLVIRVDEIEKALAGSTGAVADSTGASQGILGSILTWMQERKASGLIAYGPPGSGKTMCSLALGSLIGAPVVTFDIGSLKGSLLGQTEANVRNALRVFDAFGGRTFWCASCNSEVSLPLELGRRFRSGFWFFDLPSPEEREVIWRMYLTQYDLEDERPEDTGWTGAEIASCCEMAWNLRLSPRAAAQFIVPVARRSAEQIDAMRRNAAGKYLSASYAGNYRYEGAPTAQASAPATRRVAFTNKGSN